MSVNCHLALVRRLRVYVSADVCLIRRALTGCFTFKITFGELPDSFDRTMFSWRSARLRGRTGSALTAGQTEREKEKHHSLRHQFGWLAGRRNKPRGKRRGGVVLLGGEENPEVYILRTFTVIWWGAGDAKLQAVIKTASWTSSVAAGSIVALLFYVKYAK